MKNIFIIFIITVLAWTPLPSAQKKESTVAKKQIAVLEMTSNGVPESFGIIARNSFEVFLFNSDKFQLLDREQLQKIARRLGVNPNSATSSEDLLKLGKNLSADFLICGSIDKLDDYKITIRVISVDKGEIITAHSRNFSSAAKIDTALDILTDKTTRDIVTYCEKGRIRKPFFEQHNLFMGFSANYLMPMSGLENLVVAAPGGRMNFEMDNILANNGFAGLQLGYYGLNGRKNSQDEARFFLAELTGGYRLFITKWFYLKGELGVGGNLVTLSHKGNTGFNMTPNTQQTSIKPMAHGGGYLGILPGYDLNIEIGATYGSIFESGGPLTYLNSSMAIMILF